MLTLRGVASSHLKRCLSLYPNISRANRCFRKDNLTTLVKSHENRLPIYQQQWIRLSSTAIIRSRYPDAELPNSSLAEYLTKDFDRFGDEIALVNGITGESVTFLEIKERLRSIGSALSRLGYKKGDVFCLFLKNCPEFALTLWGVTTVGGVATTANPAYTADELLHQLSDSNTQFILTTRDLLETTKEAAEKYGKIKRIYTVGEGDDNEHPFMELISDDGSAYPDDICIDVHDDIAVLPYSSGTTGLPKGVMLTHANCVQNMAQMSCHQDLLEIKHKHDVSLAVLPFFHIYGMMPVLTNTVRMGGKVVTLPSFEAELYLSLIEKHKVTILNIVPPIAVFLAKHEKVSDYDLSSVEDIVSAAAPLSTDMESALVERLGRSVVRQGYGMTETAPVSHLVPKGCSRPGSCGVLLPNSFGKIVNPETGEILEAGMDGEICMKGPHIMKGYLNKPDATKNTIDSDGFLHSGDIGHIDEEGFFYIVDRVKELIKYKGFQVAPAELEGILLTHSGILDAAVVGKYDERAGELPTAFVVLKENSVLSEIDIANFVSSKVTDLKKLRGGVVIVDEIPKSASGKILRRILRDQINNTSN
ncbi:putative 4-coumarate--CoA ligase 1 [Tubulanus polymorphus]|uniref:putative 4-coumarate--CoA ligase 1 n=1 Tax=Tubulanus polymorphus TaxID=672921 RepID=UPI003DA5D190